MGGKLLLSVLFLISRTLRCLLILFYNTENKKGQIIQYFIINRVIVNTQQWCLVYVHMQTDKVLGKTKYLKKNTSYYLYMKHELETIYKYRHNLQKNSIYTMLV